MESEAPAALPEDALAEVLRRLPPHLLPRSRLVCKAWRDAVDDRLRGNLLPRSVRGIFINFEGEYYTEFFSRPSTGPAVDGELGFLPCTGVKVKDHCDGLLLCRESGYGAPPRPREYVVNPATRRWARLPRRPPPHFPGFDHTAHLAFDPAVSPHYQVFVIPRVPSQLPSNGESDDDDDNNPLLELEWPPASYLVDVFSSVTRRWDTTTFIREGEAAGIVADMQFGRWYYRYLYHAVYWQSALYILCEHGYLTRICLCLQTYRVIRLPGASKLIACSNHRLGRSSRGVYCAILDGSTRLQVWYLNESCNRIEWVLKHDTRLKNIYHCNYAQQLGRQWILQSVNPGKEDHEQKYDYDWNSDEDNVLDIDDVVEEAEDVAEEAEDVDEDEHNRYYFFLGFHPYKEVVFLNSAARGLAYDWINSRFQDLGSSWICQGYGIPYGKTDVSFPYTPCWISEFPGNELETLRLDEKLYRNKLELEAQLKEESNFTYTDEYELRKQSGRAKRVKDSAAKIRRGRHIAAR
ncbi:uncharacterized protein LOC123403402 [Hordeum vulgare subsp. vulgare]|uniref:uncharacterized protein LOC123403402 n=1 Tax=Hordeum vulgare subsp. vulgare TaxID=112509 RepID=UPI000B4876E4|nr:uncharacterized protein LOC123403402 [Hordeum vulgare subsp. vulgare]